MLLFRKIKFKLWRQMLSKSADKKGYYISDNWSLADFKEEFLKSKENKTKSHIKKSNIVVSPENVLLLKSGDQQKMQSILDEILTDDASGFWSTNFDKLILIGGGWGNLDDKQIPKTDGAKKFILKKGKVVLWFPRISNFSVFLEAEGLRPFCMLWMVFVA